MDKKTLSATVMGNGHFLPIVILDDAIAFVCQFGTDLSITHAQSVLVPFVICVQRERSSAVENQENVESEPK